MAVTNKLNTKSINELRGFDFFIDEYQRGYKWTVQQVLDLLEDVSSFNNNKDAFYCLQPIAVQSKQWENNKNRKVDGFEVIDGQQRLTTIFIVLKVLNGSLFSITYRTRPKSEEFLHDIEKNIDIDINIGFNDDLNILSQILDEKWIDYISCNKEYDNIDIYHFFCAYLLVNVWFGNDQDKKQAFLENLLEFTRFIWYEDKNTTNSKLVFRNLNSGKIPLTNAELIKALFINELKDINKEVQELQQHNFASEWDMIEQSLNDDKFWFFVNNDTNTDRYQTRIDFLFEIIAGKKHKENKDSLHTYRKFVNGEVELNWNRIKELYFKLYEWYSDRETYHLIGYIIDRKFSVIEKLINESEGVPKSYFLDNLVEIIKVNLKISLEEKDGAKYLESLNFKDDYEDVKNLLILFNIEQYQSNISGFRFPFYEFKNTKWSIEHIHAQHADDFNSIVEVKGWLDESENLLKDFRNHEEISEDLSKSFGDLRAELEKNSGEKDDVFTESIKNKLEITIEQASDIFDVHKIKNLALLDGPSNSGLGKRTFPAKRQYILEINKSLDGNKAFIPLATTNVFQKYYTNNVKQYDFWGYQDRADYIAEIRKVLNKYFLNNH